MRYRELKIFSLTLGVTTLFFMLGMTVYASNLMAQLISLAAGETATIVCEGERLVPLSQTTNQIEVLCETPPTPAPEPTATPEPHHHPTTEPGPPPNPGSEEFNPRQIPIELQAWWAPAYGHIHAAAKLPLGQKVSGMLNFDVRIILHDNPSPIKELRIDDDSAVRLRIPLNLTCPATETCAFNVPVSLDTTKLKDGWREIRIRAQSKTPDGKDFLTSSGIPLFVENGNSRSDYNRGNNQGLTGRGWYDGFDYTNAWIETVPVMPISGAYTFRVRAQKPSQRLTVEMDKTHHVPAVGPWPEVHPSDGRVLFDQNGDFQDWIDIPVDTTQLANGWHSISVKSIGPDGEISQCNGCPNEISFPAGVAKIWFYVHN
jgi:hypothetical protein